MLLRKSSQILADFPKLTRIVTIREPLVAVSTGCQKPLETLWRILKKIVGHSGFQKPVDMGNCGFRKFYCDCTSGFLCSLNQWESCWRTLLTQRKIGALRTNFCRSCLKQFLFKTKNYERNPKQSWFNHKNPKWYPISGETLPITSTEA